MPSVGHLSSFNPSVDDIEVWLQAFTSYLIANDYDPSPLSEKDAADETKRNDYLNRLKKCKAIFLASVGLESLSVLSTLLAPHKPEDFSLSDLQEGLRAHYKPTPKALSERFRFTGRKQKEGETVQQFVAELRRLARHCKFEAAIGMTELEVRIRDQLLFGISNERAQNQLFQREDTLTLSQAITIVEAQESADASTTLIRGVNSSPAQFEVNRVPIDRRKKQAQQHEKTGNSEGREDHKKCGRCGSKKHRGNTCPHKSVKCFKCEKVGHFADMCKSDGGGRKKQYSTNTVATVNRTRDSEDDTIWIQVKIGGVPHTMEFDSGCKKSLLSESFWRRQLRSPNLQKSKCQFKTYTDQTFSPVGDLKTFMEYEGQTIEHSIPVTNGTSLFGRDLMKKFNVNWDHIASQCNRVSETLTLKSVLNEYSDVFSKSQGRIKDFRAKIILKDDARPKFMKARPIPFAIREKVDAELRKMEELGHIERIEHSDWASPLVVVPKANGKVRITGDFKETINSQLCVNQYPIASPEEIFNAVSGGDTFTTLDGPDAYHQIELDEESKKYLVINTPRGLFRYNVLPQGIASSPAIFQECMDKIMAGIPMSGSFLDDGVCSGKSDQQHLQNLKMILQRMRESNYRLSKEKSEFMKKKVKYLGHILSKEGIHTDPAKVEAVLDMKRPTGVTELKSFMGMVTFYARFIPNVADICKPMYNLEKKNTPWKWTKECEEAFIKIKKALASNSVLAHFNPEIPVGISCDASQRGLGVVLFHRMSNGDERPIQYASRTLNDAESRYSQIEKEGLAIIFGLKKFYKYLLGRKFILVTDHKPLVAIFGPKKSLPPLVATRLHHWALYMTQFQYTIEYRKTNDHGNADALSRLPSKTTATSEDVEILQVNLVFEETIDTLPVTVKQMRYYTNRDKVLSRVANLTMSGWPQKLSSEDNYLRPYFTRREEITTQQGVLMWGTRAIVPTKLRAKILDELHESHAGIVRMKSLARQYVWWPGLDDEIESMGKTCCSCAIHQRDPARAPLHPWQYPNQAWERLHADLAGPFMGKMWLVIVDAYSKWPEIFCLYNDTTSGAVIAKMREVFGRFGIPIQLVTDNGRQFVSEEFKRFCSETRIRHSTSSVYHPKSNGEAERMVQSFKNAMKKGEGDIHRKLQAFLSHYRMTPHATTGSSPSELLIGRRARNKFDLLIPDARENVIHSQEKQKEHHDKVNKPRDFTFGQNVWVKTFMKNEPKWSKGTIVEALGPLTYTVKVGEREMKRHVEQIVHAGSPPSSPQKEKPDQERINQEAAVENKTEQDVLDSEERDSQPETPPLPPQQGGPPLPGTRRSKREGRKVTKYPK